MTGQKASVIDSLEASLNTIQDTNKVNSLNELAWEYKNYDSEKSISYARQAQLLADSIDFSKGEATSWNRIGNVYEAKGENEKALAAYQSALSIDERIGHKYGMVRGNHQIATIYQRIADFSLAVRYENKSIEVLETLPLLKEKMLMPYIGLGNIYKAQGKYEEAVRAYYLVLTLSEKHQNLRGLATAYNSLGLVYVKQRLFDKALVMHNKCLAIQEKRRSKTGIANSYNNLGNVYFYQKQFDPALEYYQKSLELKGASSDLERLGNAYHNIGVIYEQKEMNDSALVTLEKGLDLRMKVGNDRKLAESYYFLGKNKFKYAEYDSALVLLTKSLDLAKETHALHLQPNILNEIANVHKALNNPSEAFSNRLISAELKDSLVREERRSIDLDDKLELALREIELEKITTQNQTRILYALGVGSVFLLLAIFTGIISIRQKQRAVLAEKDVQISRDEIDNLLQKQELKLMSAMLEGQDEERNRIAADLHDRLGGILSVVRLHFKSLREKTYQLDAQSQKQYAITSELLNEACDTVRSISHDIGDSLLLSLGLVPALQDLGRAIEASRELDIHVIQDGLDHRLNSQIEINVFKIIQELISNVLKHADANIILIQLILRADNILSVTVEDDGTGFNNDPQQIREGMGMFSIRSRVKNLNGSISIDSQPGTGTTVTIVIPCLTFENIML